MMPEEFQDGVQNFDAEVSKAERPRDHKGQFVSMAAPTALFAERAMEGGFDGKTDEGNRRQGAQNAPRMSRQDDR